MRARNECASPNWYYDIYVARPKWYAMMLVLNNNNPSKEMNQNIAKITSLATEIDDAIQIEINETQQRLTEVVFSLNGMNEVASRTMLPQIQRVALAEALAAAQTALRKVESAWELKSVSNVLPMADQKAA